MWNEVFKIYDWLEEQRTGHQHFRVISRRLYPKRLTTVHTHINIHSDLEPFIHAHINTRN